MAHVRTYIVLSPCRRTISTPINLPLRKSRLFEILLLFSSFPPFLREGEKRKKKEENNRSYIHTDVFAYAYLYCVPDNDSHHSFPARNLPPPARPPGQFGKSNMIDVRWPSSWGKNPMERHTYFLCMTTHICVFAKQSIYLLCFRHVDQPPNPSNFVFPLFLSFQTDISANSLIAKTKQKTPKKPITIIILIRITTKNHPTLPRSKQQCFSSRGFHRSNITGSLLSG